MVDDAHHPTDALQDALDHRLDAAAQARLDAHLSSCETCRRELAALEWARSLARSARRSHEPARDLEAGLRAALDEEDRVPAASAPLLRRLAPWLAAAAAIAVAVWMVGRLRTSPIPDAVAADFRAYRSNALPLEAESASPAALEAHFVERGLPFPMRVFDLGMMEYQLVGASVRAVRGRSAALVFYRGPAGRSLLCRMYEGRIAELPEPIERRTNDGITFHIYRDREVTLVFWQEGAVVCVLAGDSDPETVVNLAFAKAIRL